MSKSNPRDATAKNVSVLRKEVKVVSRKLNRLEGYYDDQIAEIRNDIDNLMELVKKVAGNIKEKK